MNTWTCENCGKTFERPRRRKFRFCSLRCSGLFLKPGKKNIIEDESKMSLRTKYRRRAARGETQAVFRFPFNEEFFFTWTDELAWLLGLIWTDGNLNRNSIEVCSKDKCLIEKIAVIIEQKNGVRPKNKGTAWRILFSSTRVRIFLETLGLHPNKSLTIDWPVGLPEEYAGAFIRGALDGDGSVCLTQARSGQKVADLHVYLISASKDFAISFMAHLAQHGINSTLGERAGLRQGWATQWRVNVCSQHDLHSLYQLIYPSGDVLSLSRKKALFDQWVNTPRAKPGPKKGWRPQRPRARTSGVE